MPIRRQATQTNNIFNDNVLYTLWISTFVEEGVYDNGIQMAIESLLKVENSAENASLLLCIVDACIKAILLPNAHI